MQGHVNSSWTCSGLSHVLVVSDALLSLMSMDALYADEGEYLDVCFALTTYGTTQCDIEAFLMVDSGKDCSAEGELTARGSVHNRQVEHR